jgi:CMP-N-acetylneuraminic acid synthetase
VKIIAVIPARSGSKGIPNKNVVSFHGKPLLVHSIEQALASRTVGRVLVSTDSALYRDIAIAAGAEAPFLRPAAYAGDDATDLEVFVHALDWLDANEGYRPDICVHLRPTFPTRNVEDIDRAVALLLSDPTADSVRSVTRAPQTPYKMWTLDEAGGLHPLLESPLPEPWNLPRQTLPEVYLQNAAVDVVRSPVIRERRSMTGRRILAHVMRDTRDIDDWADLAAAEQGFPGGALPTGCTFAFDMDGVIATLVPDGDYSRAEPCRVAIALVNGLHDAGNRIVVYTARGSLTGRDWKETTTTQLRGWGVRHHELRFGKPAADYYVDDHMISLATLKAWVDSSSRGARRQSA